MEKLIAQLTTSFWISKSVLTCWSFVWLNESLKYNDELQVNWLFVVVSVCVIVKTSIDEVLKEYPLV